MTKREMFERLVEDGRMEVGTIDGFAGSWGSGLGYLIINGCPVMCDNAPTVRALEACFGGVIASGHHVNSESIKGNKIYYSTDCLGLLEAFTVVDEPELDEELSELDAAELLQRVELGGA